MAHRYLITGVAGFIGARLARRLLDGGDEVVGLDLLDNETYAAELKTHRLEGLRHPRFVFHPIDVARPWTGQEQLGAAPAAVFHLAARAGVRLSRRQPQEFLRVNVGGTLEALEYCVRAGVPKLVVASSSSVYGNAGTPPFAEDADTSRPLSVYAATKKAAEALTRAYHHLHGLDVSVLRYFTVYGPAGRPDMSLFRFIRRLVEGEPLTIFGDGRQLRDFTFVDDIVEGTIAAVRPLGHEAINLGGSRPVPLLDVVGLLESIVGAKARLEHHPADDAEVAVTAANVAKAARLLDWSPRTALHDGLRAAVAWYFDHREFARNLAPL